MNCIIIDNDNENIKTISEFISKIPFAKLDHIFSNSVEAITYLKQHKTDVLILEVELENLSGIEIIQLVEQKPMFILMSDNEAYAIDGYEHQVIDYLKKPISFGRFIKALNKAYSKYEKQKKLEHQKNEAPNEEFVLDSEYLFVKTGSQLKKIKYADILYIEGQGDYLKIVTTGECVMTLQNFKQALNILPQNKFVRVHKSYIVAIEKMEIIEKHTILINKKQIHISDTYKKDFYQKLKNLNIY